MVVSSVTPSGAISNAKPGQTSPVTSNEAQLSSSIPQVEEPVNSSYNYNYGNFSNPSYYNKPSSGSIPSSPPASTIKESYMPKEINVKLSESVPLTAYDPEKLSKGQTQEQINIKNTLEKYAQEKLSGKYGIDTTSESVDQYVKDVQTKGGKNINVYDAQTGQRLGSVKADQSGIDFINQIATEKQVYVREQSKNANTFYPSTVQTISELQAAKISGVTSIDIYDAKGNKISTTNPQDVTRARYDILKATISSGGPVTAKYNTTSAISSVTSTQTTQTYKEDPLSLFFRPILQFGSLIGGQIVEDIKAGKIVNEPPGLSFLTGNTGVSPNVSEKAEQTFGTGQEAVNIITGSYTPLQTVFAVGGIAASVAIPSLAGGGGKNPIANKIAYIRAQINYGKIIKAYQTSENYLVTSPVEKVGGISILSKGTEEASGMSKFTPVESKYLFIDRLITGKVQAVKGNLLPYLKSTTEITGIGKIGEKTVPREPTLAEIAERYPLFGQGKNDITDLTKSEPFKAVPETQTKPIFGEVTISKPTEVTLTTRGGQSEIPFLITEKESVSIIRSQPQDILPIQSIELTIEGSTGKEAELYGEYYGGKAVPGKKNTFEIFPTSENIEKLAEGLSRGVVKQGTDILKFSRKDFAKNPDLYIQISRNPEVLETKNITILAEVGENITTEEPFIIKPEKLTQFVRPKVIRTMVARGISHEYSKARPENEFTISDLSNIGQSVGAGAAGKASALIQESAKLEKLTGVKNITEKAKPSQRGSSLTGGRSISSIEDLLIETKAYPPSSGVKPISRLSTESIISTKSKSDIISESGIKQFSKSSSDISSKLRSNQITNLSQETGSKIDTLLGISTKQTTSLITSTKQTTTQQTVQGLITGKPGGTTPGKPPNFSILFNEKKKKKKGKKAKGLNRADFLGNVSENAIIGIYKKRADITYGQSAISKLTGSDKSKYQKGAKLITSKKIGIKSKSYTLRGKENKNMNILSNKGKKYRL